MNEPVKDYKQAKYPNGDITQWFGENPDIYRPWGLKAHNGIDIVRPHGSKLLAVEDGVVVDVKLAPDGYGKHIRIRAHKEDNWGYKREWSYGHMSKIHVVVGEPVKAGDVVGLMGNTGFVISGDTPFWKYNPYAGTHLHLGLRMVKEDQSGWSYNSVTPKINVKDYGNGYKGSIDWRNLYEDEEEQRRQMMLTIISLLNTLLALLKARS